MRMFEGPLLLAALALQSVPTPPPPTHVAGCGAAAAASSAPVADCCLHLSRLAPHTSRADLQTQSARANVAVERTDNGGVR